MVTVDHEKNKNERKARQVRKFHFCRFHSSNVYIKERKHATEVPNRLANRFNAGKMQRIDNTVLQNGHWNVKFVFDLTDGTAHFTGSIKGKKKQTAFRQNVYSMPLKQSTGEMKGDRPPWKLHKNLLDMLT